MSEFDQKALDWDKNRMHHDRTVAIAAKLKEMLPLHGGMTAMEFGAGTGLLSFELKDQFSAITLVDNSAEMLKMAEQKLEQENHPAISTVFVNLENESYSGKAVDILYSQMALHHVGDVRLILSKFYRLLNPGGFLAIADLYAEDGTFHDGAAGVHHGFDPAKLKELLSGEGFGDFRSETCFVIRKEVPGGLTREYPVFLLTAGKPALTS